MPSCFAAVKTVKFLWVEACKTLTKQGRSLTIPETPLPFLGELRYNADSAGKVPAERR